MHVGFTHVSDDDYARVTIAQAFAHAPHLDPSGTSWLPFPFWLNGAVMAVLGRSLAVARGVAIASGIAGAVLVHRAFLHLGAKPWVAFAGVALAMSAPWSAWLGVATVPEALSASLIAAGTLCLCVRGAHLGGAVALFVASLSRYEAWPVAFVFAVACAVSARKEAPPEAPSARRADLFACFLAAFGPLAWIVWNAHAHGDPLHFVARVAAYRVRMGSSVSPEGLRLYPEAFVHAAPLTLILAALGAPGLFVDPALRKRWIGPLVAMVALILFLIEGDLHNGAPTHHPERALIAVFWCGCMFGVDGARSLAMHFVWAHPKREAWLVGLVAATLAAWGLSWPMQVRDYPAHSESENRARELAMGDDLRTRDVRHVTITPCAYEHFATIAAYGAPERVTVVPHGGVEVGEVTGACPRVEER